MHIYLGKYNVKMSLSDRVTFYIIMLFFFIFTNQAQASVYSYIDKVELEGDKRVYHFTLSAWDYNDMSPNPCFLAPRCAVGLSHKHAIDGQSGFSLTEWRGTQNSGVSCVVDSRSIGELGECLARTPSNVRGRDNTGGNLLGSRLVVPFSGKAGHVGATLTRECVGVFYYPGDSIETKGILLPGSLCGLAPEPETSCTMPDNIEIDHGVVNENELMAHGASSAFNINCNEALNAIMYMKLKEGMLELGGGIKSKITLNGEPVTDKGVGIKLLKGDTTVKISSTLTHLSPSAPGVYSGQSIIILSML